MKTEWTYVYLVNLLLTFWIFNQKLKKDLNYLFLLILIYFHSQMFNKNSRHQYDFLNPNDRKNLRLNSKKEWEEDV